MNTEMWFNNCIIYQVCIPSYYDKNADGIGDIPGLISKLEYIKSLGADAIYLNPISKAKCDDAIDAKIKDRFIGYESIGLTTIDPRYGSMDDFQELVKQVHSLGLRIIVDFITIGVSTKHPFWQDVIANPESKYREFFIIEKEYQEGPWLNFCGVPWNKMQDERYYYSLWRDWPSFNYKNYNFINYIYSVADFWLDQGIDGFRLDAAKFLFINGPGFDKQEHQPETLQFWKNFKSHILKNYGDDKVLIAEVIPYPINVDYIGENREMADFLYEGVFAESLFNSSSIDVSEFNAEYFDTKFDESDSRHKIIYNSNHDKGRLASKVKDSALEKRKLLAGLQLLSNGTPLIYFGDEIGLRDASLNNELDYISTMRWDASEIGGYTCSDNISHPAITKKESSNNVFEQENLDNSLLNYYKKLIKLRKEHRVFANGNRLKIKQTNESVFAYILYDESETVLVLHNLDSKNQNLSIDLDRYLEFTNLNLIFNLNDLVYWQNKNQLVVKELTQFSNIVFSFGQLSEEKLRTNKIDQNKVITCTPDVTLKGINNFFYKLNNFQNKALLLQEGTNIEIKHFTKNINKDVKLENSLYLTRFENIMIPFSNKTNYFSFSKKVNFKIINYDWQNVFSLSAKYTIENSSNKTLKKFSWGRDANFWYLCIESENLILPRNGGLDFAILFHDPSSEFSTDKLSFWKLPEITTSKCIHSIILYQDGLREKKPTLYTGVTRTRQPGIKRENGMIFSKTANNFFMILTDEYLNKSNYLISVIVWSAGGNWGESKHKKSPISEIIPLSTVEPITQNNNYINNFMDIEV